jgi:hypothetical protein
MESSLNRPFLAASKPLQKENMSERLASSLRKKKEDAQLADSWIYCVFF